MHGGLGAYKEACWGAEARMVTEDGAEVLTRRAEHQDLVVRRVAHVEPIAVLESYRIAVSK